MPKRTVRSNALRLMRNRQFIETAAASPIEKKDLAPAAVPDISAEASYALHRASTMVLAVCESLAPGSGALEADLEVGIIGVLRTMMLSGVRGKIMTSGATPEMAASMTAGAVFAAVKEWLSLPDRGSKEELIEMISKVLGPMLQGHERPKSWAS